LASPGRLKTRENIFDYTIFPERKMLFGIPKIGAKIRLDRFDHRFSGLDHSPVRTGIAQRRQFLKNN